MPSPGATAHADTRIALHMANPNRGSMCVQQGLTSTDHLSAVADAQQWRYGSQRYALQTAHGHHRRRMCVARRQLDCSLTCCMSCSAGTRWLTPTCVCVFHGARPLEASLSVQTARQHLACTLICCRLCSALALQRHRCAHQIARMAWPTQIQPNRTRRADRLRTDRRCSSHVAIRGDVYVQGGGGSTAP